MEHVLLMIMADWIHPYCCQTCGRMHGVLPVMLLSTPEFI